MKGPAIGDGGGRCRAYGDNLEGTYLIDGEVGLENGGVGAFLGTLAGGCRVFVIAAVASTELRRTSDWTI